MEGRTKARLLLGLRVLVSGAMLAVLVPRIHLASLFPSRQLSTLGWLVGGLLVYTLAVFLSTVRWGQVLEALDIPSHLPPLVSHTLAGMFVSNFLPSTVGGDVLRVTRLAASNGQRHASLASVVVERLTGFLVLPFITLVALVGNPTLLHLGRASRLSLTLALGTLGALVAILLLVSNPRVGERFAGRSWLGFVGAVHLGLARLRREPAAALGVLVSALAYQLTMVAGAWMAGHAMGIHVGWSAMMAFIPIVAIAQVLPISVSGLGLREGALVILLVPLGVTSGQAVAFGLVLYGMNMAVSLLGAPAFAVGARPARVVA
ncbi:MAG TPA: lysylphosphatidylglycerol synthase transmembrane domain-containing protein [Acidimicrobiales bacterium]|nr:lysylphosphatidylglycerol synthase transmembrane domain-containing protein [Acidimicrobiales bacterium]